MAPASPGADPDLDGIASSSSVISSPSGLGVGLGLGRANVSHVAAMEAHRLAMEDDEEENCCPCADEDMPAAIAGELVEVARETHGAVEYLSRAATVFLNTRTFTNRMGKLCNYEHKDIN